MKKFLILTSLFFTGCATIFSGTTQTIHVKVVDSANNSEIDHPICVLRDARDGQYSFNSAQTTISVAKGNGAINIDCKKEGYRQLNMAVGDSFNAVTIVNVLFWPGFIVDAISGAHKKYPSHYIVNMEQVK